MSNEVDKNRIETLCETRFLSLYDLQYAEGKHYFEATRRTKENLVAKLDYWPDHYYDYPVRMIQGIGVCLRYRWHPIRSNLQALFLRPLRPLRPQAPAETHEGYLYPEREGAG